MAGDDRRLRAEDRPAAPDLHRRARRGLHADQRALITGAGVRIRPIAPGDGPRLQRAFGRLSAETRYRRFLGAKPQLTAADARYLVDVDGSDHLALVAAVDEDIVGVARFVRTASDPGCAEFAIVVADDWQRRGLGTRLLTELAAAARRRGIARFTAAVLPTNTAILRVAARVAAGDVSRRRTGGGYEIAFDLPGLGAPPMIPACAGG